MFILVLLFVHVSPALAQIPATPTNPPFTVTVDSSLILSDPIIIHSDQFLTDLTVMKVNIITDTSSVTIESLLFVLDREWLGVFLSYGTSIKIINLYDDANVLLAQREVHYNRCDFDNLKIVIAKNAQKTLTFRFDKISGSGIVQSAIDLVQGTVQATGEYYVNFGSVYGPRFNFVDPEKTEVLYSRSPIPDQDTMFVYSGQHWYLSESYSTAQTNHLSNIITGANLIVNNKFDGTSRDPKILDFCIQSPWIFNDTLGVSFIDQSSSNTVSFQWYSKYSFGLNGINGFNRWGYNSDSPGTLRRLWSGANIVYYSPYFASPRSQSFSSNVYILTVDGIRGDVSGNKKVAEDDIELMAHGQQSYQEMYHNNVIDFGRGLVLFSWPNDIDTWLINVWLHNPNDPLVANLGIGELMSQRKIVPQPAPFTPTVIGKILTIKTNGFAVNVIGMINGKPWSQAVQVVNGQATIELPDPNMKYQIESVSLPSSATDVKSTNIPVTFSLDQNYPNPFNPVTTISYSLPKSEFVTLKIYDILGREVATLINEEKSAGNYQINFDASQIASGTYVYRLTAGTFTQVKKMVLIK